MSYLQFPLQVYTDQDYRENYLKSSGKMIINFEELVTVVEQLSAQNLIDIF